MKTDRAVIMSMNGSSGQDTLSSSITSPNESLPPSVVHVSRDELRKFLKCKRVGNYLLGKTIGEGSFAKVKQGFHVLTGEKVAVKIIDKKQAMEDRYVSKNMRREAKILQMVRHPNVIQLLEVVETENRYYLVFEIAGGGDLMDYICYRKKLGEIEVRKFIRQIISAVHYLHQGGIIHRDLKVENLLLDEHYNIKLIDFGLSNTINVSKTGERSSSREFCKTQCGSPAYAAPEILGHLTYGTKVDVWSIGVNMFAMLTGKLPYTAEPFNIMTLYNKMTKGDMNPVPERLSAGCKDLLLRFLTFDPKERISIDEAIQHPWLRKGFEDDPLLPVEFASYLRAHELNANILDHMTEKMQFKRHDVIEGVTSNKSNAASCVYHLINRKLKRYLEKHPSTRILRRTKSKDDEVDAVPKKQRIDDADNTNQILEQSRRETLQTSRDLRLGSGGGSSQGSRRLRIGVSASQGSRGPRGRLASDKDGTEMKGSTIIPNSSSDHYLALPGDASVQKSGAFNQESIEIEDDEAFEDVRRDLEGHDPANRKVSLTYDYLTERKLSRPNYHPFPLAKDYKPPVLVFDDINNDNTPNCQEVNGQENLTSTNTHGLTVDTTTNETDVTEKANAMDDGMENDDVIKGKDAAKDAGEETSGTGVSNVAKDAEMEMAGNDDVIDEAAKTAGENKSEGEESNIAKDTGTAPVIDLVVAKVVSVQPSPELEALMDLSKQGASEPDRSNSLPTSPQRGRAESLPSIDPDMAPPVTRPRSDSLPTTLYPVTRGPTPIRKPSQPNQSLTPSEQQNSAAPKYGLACLVTSVQDKKEPGKEYSDSAQLMVRSTLSPLSVHCSPKPSRRHSTPLSPMKDFYKEVLGFPDNTPARGSPNNKAHYGEKTQSAQDLRGSPSPRPLGSPMVSRRFSASSTSSEDSKRALTPKTIHLPVAPKEPLLPNLSLKLLMKQPPIEPLTLPTAPLSPRKLSLDSKTKRGKENSKDQRSRRRRNTVELPRREFHEPADYRDVRDTNQSHEIKKSRDELRDNSSHTSDDPHHSNVRARVTVKERRQTTDLNIVRHTNEMKHEVICNNNNRYGDSTELPMKNSLKEVRDNNDELRDKTIDSRDSHSPRDNHPSRERAKIGSHISTIHNRNTGNVKARVTIKERRQTSELDLRSARRYKKIQFQITDTHDVNGHVAQRESRVKELRHERRSSVPALNASGPQEEGVRRREESVNDGDPMVRHSSVPVLNSQSKRRDSKEGKESTKSEKSNEKFNNHHMESLQVKEAILKQRTRSENDVKEITRQTEFGNPWEKHERTIQRTIAMRAEAGKKKAAERIRRHTVGSPVVNNIAHEQRPRSSKGILKKSLV